MSAGNLQDALGRLVGEPPGFEPLAPSPAVGERPGAVAVGRPGSSSGNAAPGALAEKDAAAREYYAQRSMTSSDGIITIVWTPIKSVLMEDDTRATFKDPPA